MNRHWWPAEWQGSNWIRRPKRLAIYRRDGWRCVYCCADLSAVEPTHRTLDHLVPRCEGGNNEPRNLVMACKRCNSSRGSESVFAFCTVEQLRRINRQTQAALV